MHFTKCINGAKMTNFQLTANVINFAKDKAPATEFWGGAIWSLSLRAR